MTGQSFEEIVRGVRGARTIHIPPVEPDVDDGHAEQPGGQKSQKAGKAKGTKKPIDTSSIDGFDPTEDGIALAFAKAHQDLLRFDHSAGKWFRWNGSHWEIDNTQMAFSWARATCRQKARECAADEKQYVTLAKAATAAAVERFARADQNLAATADTWDSDPYLLGTPGGTVDLRTGAVRPALRQDYITKIAAVGPSETPDCPLWLAFLKEATNGDDGFIRFLQQWCGYSLTGDTREHALLFAYGPGGNGKSVFLNTVAGVMGSYATVAAMDTFTASSHAQHPTDLAKLQGARLVSVSEVENERNWAEKRINQLTGGDKITARFMRQDFFDFTPQCKLTIVGNHKPGLQNVNAAARRRINMAPFLHKPTTVDRNLAEKLRAEWPGILQWMIRGCLDWQASGLVRPAVLIEATASYFDEQDLPSQWIEQCCDCGPNKSDTAARLFGSWKAFAEVNGEKPESSKWFNQTLTNLGFTATKSTPGARGHRGFLGIALKPLGMGPD